MLGSQWIVVKCKAALFFTYGVLLYRFCTAVILDFRFLQNLRKLLIQVDSNIIQTDNYKEIHKIGLKSKSNDDTLVIFLIQRGKKIQNS